MEDDQKLADDILAFLDRHARKLPDHDPDLEAADEAFTGPDPVTLLHAAQALRSGGGLSMPWSEWGSGCYFPMGDTPARAWHDRLVSEIRQRLGRKLTP